MSTKRATIEATGTPIRGPWEEPLRPALPATVPQTDPRVTLSENALVLASQNAYPVVASQKTRRDNVGLAAGAAIALVLGCATFVSLNSSRHGSTAPAMAPGAATPARPGLPVPAAVPAKPVGAPVASTVAPQPGPMPNAQHMPGAVVAPGMPPAAAPVLVYDGSNAPSSAVPASPAAGRDVEGAPALLAGGSPVRGVLADNASVRSTRLADPANTVVQGTLIPAVLETAIDTDVPGYVRAVVSQDVRSFDGSRILIPRSSRLIGEYKGVSQAGQRRAYLMWTRLVRPDGVSVALASPAADFSGQAGIGGQVNSHFFSRFGSSILLSILGGAGTLATGGASTVIVGGAGQSAASVAAQHDGQRPTTIKVRQGEPIRVFTARDLVFSDGGNG
ncbi:MAG TPA: TrbI/VirB10 family protein [Sphingomicrobium sp.]